MSFTNAYTLGGVAAAAWRIAVPTQSLCLSIRMGNAGRYCTVGAVKPVMMTVAMCVARKCKILMPVPLSAIEISVLSLGRFGLSMLLNS